MNAQQEKLASREANHHFRAASSLITKVTAHSHSEFSRRDGIEGNISFEVPVSPNTQVLTRSGEMQIDKLTISGGVNLSAAAHLGTMYDSRIVSVNFHKWGINEKKLSAVAKINGSALYNGQEFFAGNSGIPLLLLSSGKRKERIKQIASHANRGLIVARYIEVCSAEVAERSVDTEIVDKIDLTRANLVEFVGGISLEENVAALLPPFVH